MADESNQKGSPMQEKKQELARQGGTVDLDAAPNREAYLAWKAKQKKEPPK